jgi:hypothetical protein
VIGDAARGAWLLLSGHHYDGVPRTDAGWFRPGRIDVTPPHARARRGHYRPRAQRAGMRSAVIVFGVLFGWALIVHPPTAHALIADTFWITVVFVGHWTAYKLRKYQVHREIRNPLALWLATTLSDARYITQPDKMIAISGDPLNRPTRIYLPPTYVPGTQATEDRFVRSIAAKIRLPSPTATWDLGGDAPYLELTPAPEPPTLVSYADPDVRALYEAATALEPFLGLGPRSKPFYCNRLASAPHCGTSATTNAGKSSARRPTVAKAIRDGWLVLILDVKQDSQVWAETLPAVHYAVTAHEHYAALHWLSREIDRRFAIYRAHKTIDGDLDPEWQAAVGRPILVIAEELNSMELDIRAWWKQVRQPGDPAMCPAMYALQRSLNMGRGVGIYVEPIAQTMTCQSIGGPAALENIPMRLLIWPTWATWNRLAPQCKVAGKYPKTAKVQGRVHVVMGDESSPVQTMWMTPREAHDYAAGAPDMAVFPPVFEDAPMWVDVDEEGGEDGCVFTGRRAGATALTAAPSSPDVEDAVEDAEIVPTLTLTQAAEKFGVSRKTLENHATRRTSGFPTPIEKPRPGRAAFYAAAELEAWIESHREREGAAT